jgi:hypothetical protein
MTDSKKRKLEGAPAAQASTGAKGDRASESISAKVGGWEISRHMGSSYIKHKANNSSIVRRLDAW